SPGYFAAMGIPLLLGRDLSERDDAGAPLIAIVNETFAHYYLGDGNPIGRRMGFSKDKFDIEIVGVVKDSKYGGLREGAIRMAYFPVAQRRLFGSLVLHLRTAGDPALLIAAARAGVRELNSKLPVFGIQTVEQQVERSLIQDRLISTLSD